MNVYTLRNLLVLLLLSAPFIYIQLSYGKAVPFQLKGPEFLNFFLLFSIISCGILYNAVTTTQRALAWVPLFAIGIARAGQGLFNHKPVGYLVLMLIADVIAMVLIYKLTQNRLVKEEAEA